MVRLPWVAGVRGGLLLAGLLCAGSSLVVVVGPVAVARADANDEARFYFERGNEILQEAMRARGPRRRTLLRDAVAQYLEAVARVRSKNAIYNLALCHQELGDLDEAWTYFREYRGMAAVTEDERADADRRLAAIAPRVALVEVTSTPPGAEVRVDRPDLASRGRTPLVIPVEPGEHRILVTLAGHAPGEEPVTAVRGEQRAVAVALRAQMVRVVFESVPAGATVSLDGRAIGRTPLRGRTSVGAHQL
ncbi:MAG: PEGA domain-containing protein, partial [Deltaproteobacteria bacterium]|nr:PEGA domain-containing protein [Deltaproteobacteria bacterium]